MLAYYLWGFKKSGLFWERSQQDKSELLGRFRRTNLSFWTLIPTVFFHFLWFGLFVGHFLEHFFAFGHRLPCSPLGKFLIILFSLLYVCRWWILVVHWHQIATQQSFSRFCSTDTAPRQSQAGFWWLLHSSAFHTFQAVSPVSSGGFYVIYDLLYGIFVSFGCRKASEAFVQHW